MYSVLSVHNLIKRFSKSFTAVNDISFGLHEGEILGLLGPNGAGKTTTIQMLLGIMTPTSGEINYFGKNFSKNRSASLQKISFASTYVRMPGRLTISQNLDIYGQLYSIPYSERKERIEKFLKFFDLWNIKDRESGALSAGQITRVMLAKAFISNPSIVLLDEPTASLDPDISQEVRAFIVQQQKERGVSVLLTSHNMDEVTEICNRVLVLQNGNIIANNTPAQLAATVTNAKVHLFITKNLDKAKQYFENESLVTKTSDDFIEIEIDEYKIAKLLNDLAKLDVYYEQIYIDKPSLEDYFLQVARKSKKI